jgi:hypothetical protein
MSAKRSDRLRTMIAATVTEAAENAAPVSVTGSSIPAGDTPEPRVKTPDLPTTEPVLLASAAEPGQTPLNDAVARAADRIGETDMEPQRDGSPPPIAVAPRPSSTSSPESRDESLALLRAPERPVKLPKWEKANVTLEPRDLAILQRSDEQARAYGFRIRKGGNPSLFVRAGLRLLSELCDRDPETWIKRIAATTSTGQDVPE